MGTGRAVRYGQIDFDPEFLSGTDDRGKAIKFTRTERLLLKKLSENSGIVLSRERLLDALSGAGSDAYDRNVDFLVNRLRRKLEDPARSPSYIETRYGEGYLWIAERVERAAKSSGAFLVIGPLRGLQYIGSFADQARSYAEQLCSRLDRSMARKCRVVVDEDCLPAEHFAGDKPKYAVELDFLDTDGRLDCAATVRTFGTGQIVRALRYTVADGDSGQRSAERKAVGRHADEIAAAIWDQLAYPANHLAPSEDVLAVRMHAATELFATAEPWLEADRRLRAALEKNADDFQSRLMLATNLHSKYLLSGMILPEADNRTSDEHDMEELVLSSLPHLQDNPVFVMAAAKLLYFLGRGHQTLAAEIAESAFGTTTAFATSFAILGQIRMFEGELEEAVALFDRGLELVPNGTHFDLYLLTLKCQALLAGGDRSALAATFDVYGRRRPEIRPALSVFFTPTEPGEVLPEAQVLADRIDERRARAMLLWVHYICARLFRSAEHRENVMMPSARLFRDRFGPGAVPDEAIPDLPSLFAAQAASAEDTSATKDHMCSAKAAVGLGTA